MEAKPNRHCGECNLCHAAIAPAAPPEFRCLWSKGLLDEDDRPDKSGVVLYTTDTLPGNGRAVIGVRHAESTGVPMRGFLRRVLDASRGDADRVVLMCGGLEYAYSYRVAQPKAQPEVAKPRRKKRVRKKKRPKRRKKR